MVEAAGVERFERFAGIARNAEQRYTRGTRYTACFFAEQRDCALEFCLFEQLTLIDEKEFRLRNNEPPDEPRARDAVHFDIFSSNPLHGSPHGRQEYVNFIANRFS